jgi:hypothetical protein
LKAYTFPSALSNISCKRQCQPQQPSRLGTLRPRYHASNSLSLRRYHPPDNGLNPLVGRKAGQKWGCRLCLLLRRPERGGVCQAKLSSVSKRVCSLSYSILPFRPHLPSCRLSPLINSPPIASTARLAESLVTLPGRCSCHSFPCSFAFGFVHSSHPPPPQTDPALTLPLDSSTLRVSASFILSPCQVHSHFRHHKDHRRSVPVQFILSRKDLPAFWQPTTIVLA